jgi:hypothetical protein
MQMPPANVSPNQLFRYGLYLIARLKRRPKTLPLAARFEPFQARIRELDRLTEDREAEISLFLALRDGADEDLDGLVADCEGEVAQSVKRDYSDPRYVRLFPDGGYSAITRAALDAEEKGVEKLLTALGELAKADPADPLPAKYLPLLTAALKDLRDSRGNHQTAVKAAAEARAILDLAKLEWRNAYRAIFGALTEMFPHNKKLVARCFMQPTRGGSDVEGDPPGGDDTDREPK